MLHTIRHSNAVLPRLVRKLIPYSSVGAATFALDLLLIAVFIYGAGMGYQLAVAVGFFIAVSINFLICFHVIYKDTKRRLLTGFLLFLVIAALGAVAIAYSVEYLVEAYEIALLLARTVVSTAIGLLNFLLNTFFNFRVF